MFTIYEALKPLFINYWKTKTLLAYSTLNAGYVPYARNDSFFNLFQ